MKHSIIIAVSSLLLLSCSVPRESMKSLGDRVFTLADSQFKILDSKLDADRFPRTVENGRLLDAPISWWCSGFFPGSLAYTYAYTQDPEMLQLAVKNTQKLDSLFCGRYKTSHDVGFMTVCSYGKLYELGICDTIPAMLGLAADKLASRFSPVTGTTRSWDFGKWKWPVIIDNMMNLELLMEYGTPEQQKMAMSHADRTIENHFRGDFTTWHVVDYSRKDGSVRRKQTHQGLNDDSAWARGQAWALYGYTMMSREASKKGYPEARQASFRRHPRLGLRRTRACSQGCFRRCSHGIRLRRTFRASSRTRAFAPLPENGPDPNQHSCIVPVSCRTRGNRGLPSQTQRREHAGRRRGRCSADLCRLLFS